MSDRSCPTCRSTSCSRIPRIGLLQGVILPFFGLYPWECTRCLRVFYLRTRGRSSRAQTAQAAPSSNA